MPPNARRALSLLTAPDLMDQVTDAFTTLGVVGEQTSALTAWLTLTSRLSDRPLGAVIQSSSAAGKSTLADAALALMPTEATVAYSAMTGQALYYLGETDLAHKVLSIAEEEGAARASYALEAARLRGPAVDRRGGQGPADRSPRHQHLRGHRSGGPAHDHHLGRVGRGAGQPPAGPGRRRGPRTRPGPSMWPSATPRRWRDWWPGPAGWT